MIFINSFSAKHPRCEEIANLEYEPDLSGTNTPNEVHDLMERLKVTNQKTKLTDSEDSEDNPDEVPKKTAGEIFAGLGIDPNADNPHKSKCFTIQKLH